MKRTRLQIVKTPDGFHARVKAKNNEIVWTTENYTTRAKAKKACLLLLNLTLDYERDGFGEIESVNLTDEGVK